jgi:hypothetical protein
MPSAVSARVNQTIFAVMKIVLIIIAINAGRTNTTRKEMASTRHCRDKTNQIMVDEI